MWGIKTLIKSDFAWASPVCFNLNLRYGNNTRNYAVRVGDYHTLVPEEYEEEIGVQQIVIHKEYRPDSSDYDIALVRLQGPEEQCARFSTHVLPACLPLWRERPQKTAPSCYITGWGDTGKSVLMISTLWSRYLRLLTEKKEIEYLKWGNSKK